MLILYNNYIDIIIWEVIFIMSKVIAGDYLGDIVEYLEEEKCYCVTINHSMHQRLNNNGIKIAYKCGSGRIDESQDIFVVFAFGGASSTIHLDKKDFDIVSKDIDIIDYWDRIK